MFNSEEYYRSRLQDTTLLNKAVIVPAPGGTKMLAVPCGGTRVSGYVQVNPVEQERVIQELTKLGGFPDVRADGDDSIDWGKPLPEPDSKRTFYAYIARMRLYGKMFGYSERAIEQFIRRVIVIEFMEQDGVGPNDIEDRNDLDRVLSSYREMLGFQSVSE